MTAGPANSASQATKSMTGGVAGSMARFSIVENYLYAVNTNMLHSINIEEPLQPKIDNSINAGWLIETIYPFKE